MTDALTMWFLALSDESVFCRALVACGFMTEAQMVQAVVRYRLGCSCSGGVIYWQIDHQERIHDGKIMYYLPDCHRNKQHHPTWVSAILQQRYRWADHPHASHCLFGLHLLAVPSEQRKRIYVVEAEKTAVILSARYPDHLWLATGGLGEVQAYKFRPLRGRQVVLCPDTDPDGTAFRRWSEAARDVHRQPWWEGCQPIRVSDFLERHATTDQKRRKIDLADYIYEHQETA